MEKCHRWTNEHIGKLVIMRMKGHRYSTIAEAVNKTEPACRDKMVLIKQTIEER